MTGTRRLLFVLGCVVCLLAVASALPAADPRLDGPNDRDGEPAAGEWGSIDSTPEFTSERTDDGSAASSADDEDGERDHEIEIRGAIEPGNEVTIEVDSVGPISEQPVEVNGESVGRTEWGRIDAVVPYEAEMTVALPDKGRSRTVDVETNATIETHDGAAPGAAFELSAEVGSTPVENATVSIDGEPAAETDEDGHATVTLPETAGPIDLRVERGPVEAARTVEVAEPEVRFVSPLLFPGSPAPVQVSADGTGVADAQVSIENGDASRTGADGRAIVWLPIDDETTVTTEVGEETATTTVENLYLRLGAVAVLVPGFAIGAVSTYLRVAAYRERRRGDGLDGLFVGLAGALEGLSRHLVDLFEGGSAALAELSGSIGRVPGAFTEPFDALRGSRVPSLPRFTFSAPRAGFDWRVPSIGANLSAFGNALGSLSSLGSLFGSSRTGGSPFGESPFGGLFGGDDDSDASASDENEGSTVGLADEPLAPRGPRAEIRAAWHAFLDRLDVTDRTTLTPGQAARRALVAGFPADRVYRLVSIFRDVEYGSRTPSPERVSEAREAANQLLDHDSDEEGSP